MKLIKQSYEILGTPKSLYEAWEYVAKAARNCYQSTKSKPDESEEQFCRRLLLKHEDDLECDHLSPFEFGVLYLTVPYSVHKRVYPDDYLPDCIGNYDGNSHSRVVTQWVDVDNAVGYITTNLRVILENHWEEDLKFATAPTKYHVKACCFKMITNRAVMAEITRHRTLSFCIESTRYCNYSKDKFGNELTFIKPCWLVDMEDNRLLNSQLQCVEADYLRLLNKGWSPQQASTILPNALKTTIMMCGYEDNLQHMFRLRAEECSGPVHPQMAEIMKPMYNDYKKWLSIQL